MHWLNAKLISEIRSPKPSKIRVAFNGTVHFENHKQLLEYQNFLLLSDICCSKCQYIFKCCLFIQH